ncbi:hypothetical protein [Microbacterium sp. 179-I 3D3 NHS]|uniref:hypothetical protein n=1 Tax=Microbacterium sp. 179-I 3D3 NHS TaxID=3142382 RepID=UPI00399F7A81
MFVSAETLAIVVSALGVVLTLGTTLFAGFAWFLRRLDEVEHRLGARIDEIEQRLGARIDEVEQRLGALAGEVVEVEHRLGARLGARIDALAGEVVEVKIAVARLEGPPRHLVLAAR